MALSDRTQLKAVMAGTLGALRTVTNALLAIAQDAQRFDAIVIGGVTTPGTTYTFPLVRVDRPIVIKDFRVLPGGALTASATLFETMALVYNNDAGGANTSLASYTTNLTGNGGTGNWTVGTSIPLFSAASPISGATVPAGSQVMMTLTPTSTGTAVPAQTLFQVIWEEV